MLRELWSQTDAPTAIKFFKEWYRSLIHTKLEPMKAVAWTIKERLGNVVSYCTHRITNSVAERMNGKIMSMKCRVGGFRNVESFKTAIFFYCGGLDL
jgi:transposase